MLAQSAVRLIALVLIVGVPTTGCGTMFPQYLGIRPDTPGATVAASIRTECACEQYLTHVKWATQLAEAYRTRATMNEWAIYAAGTVALAGLSVVGGLGLAAASATTIGLVGVSTGFTSGFFAFMDNSTRAGFYTTSANDLSTALAKATQTVGAIPTTQNYDTATKFLAERISQIANDLETHRSSAAAAAAASKNVQKAQQDLQDLTRLIETAALTDLSPTTAGAGDTVTVVVSGIDLTAYKDRVRIFVGGRQVAADVTSKTEATFKVPTTPATTPSETVRVWVGPAPLPGDRVLTYSRP